MFSPEKRIFLRCVFTFVGGCIGIAIFSTPFVFAQNGMVVSSALFFVLVGIVLLIHLLYIDVAETIPEKHHLMGMGKVAPYLGKKALSLIALTIASGSILVLVVSVFFIGIFIDILMSSIGGDTLLWRAVFWALMSICILKGVRSISKIELWLGASFVLLILLFVIQGAPSVSYENFAPASPHNELYFWNIVLFALFHIPSLYGAHRVIHSQKLYRKAIITGTLLVATLTMAFSLVTVGITGENTSLEAAEALFVLRDSIGGELALIVITIGLLSMSSSYLAIGSNLRDMLQYDVKVSKMWGTLCAIFVPLPFLFLDIISTLILLGVGGVSIAVIHIGCIIIAHRRARKKYPRLKKKFIQVPSPIYALIFGLCMIGGIYSAISYIASAI